MLELERALAKKLTELRVHIEVPDGDTVVFHDVPANSRFFNKGRTNLLLKRPGTGIPFYIACVDEDLEYLGRDRLLTRVFRGGIRQRGWRTLGTECRLHRELHEAAADALSALGFDGREPALAPHDSRNSPGRPGGLLANFGTDHSQLMNNSSRVESTIGRADEIDEVTSCVLRWGQKRLPVIVGESGVGKTNLLHAVALKLSKHRGPLNLISLDFGCVLAGTLFDAERENLLSALLKEAAASPATVLALERFELAARGPHGPLLLAQSLDNHMPLIGTSLPKYLPGFERAPLARRLNIVGLEELSPSETLFVLRAVRKSIARHHDVEIDETCIRCCVHAARSLPGYFPAKAIALLDAAGGKASLSDANAIRPDDVYSAVGRPAEGRESDGVGSP